MWNNRSTVSSPLGMLMVYVVMMVTVAVGPMACYGFVVRSTAKSTKRKPTPLVVVAAANTNNDNVTDQDQQHEIAMEKATKAMTAFTNKYLANTGTKLCMDPSVPAVVIKGLAEHKVNLGAPLCPCRFYEDKQAEAKDGYWNCPCVPMRERHECHCMLFLTEENDFVGESQQIAFDEVVKLNNGVA
mmetsp:Transcript_2733/g.5194  ORF Transcript_2733/g.5194 Transcript_2733/m.5194 type:complete len:186 (+) Transcript_2733:48-605(+)